MVINCTVTWLSNEAKSEGILVNGGNEDIKNNKVMK